MVSSNSSPFVPRAPTRPTPVSRSTAAPGLPLTTPPTYCQPLHAVPDQRMVQIALSVPLASTSNVPLEKDTAVGELVSRPPSDSHPDQTPPAMKPWNSDESVPTTNTSVRL